MISNNEPLSLHKLIQSDLERYGPSHSGILWEIYYALVFPHFSSVLLYRLAHAYYRKGFWGRHLARFLRHLNLFLHACDIMYEAEIGEGFFLTHPVGVVIGIAKIGKNAEIYQNVTIGVKDLFQGEPKQDMFPVIGDNVCLFAGAVIIGAIKIGNNVRVGANAVVLSDIPDNATAVGVPAKAILKS